MTVEKLERVMWRLRKRNPDMVKVTWLELKRAIMYECGTSHRTYTANKKALQDLGWIKPYKKKSFIFTNVDLTG